MFNIALKQVRTFRTAQSVRLAPLTILVGENSTGKSSFLALLRIALELARGNLEPGFNRDPFFLGAYDQIAHYRGGRGGRSQSFEISLSNDFIIPQSPFASQGTAHSLKMRAQFTKHGSQPVISEFDATCDEYALQLRLPDDKPIEVTLRLPNWRGKLPREVGVYMGDLRSYFYSFEYLPMALMHAFRAARGKETRSEEGDPPQAEINRFTELWQASQRELPPPPYAFAPVRSKPARTYNPVEQVVSAGGEHVPMLLAKTYFTDKERWERLQKALNKFGKASGLFQEIRLKTLGRSDSDPFQILLKIAGPYSNLIDVGYGISQVLPILVDTVNSNSPYTYLLQQPEVHLHPRAQAELATFLGQLIKETSSWVVMETHSDFLLDRLRSDVRAKTHLSSDQISILFFERSGRDTTIHELPMDESGNLSRVPRNYRKFFMEEEQKLLGI